MLKRLRKDCLRLILGREDDAMMVRKYEVEVESKT